MVRTYENIFCFIINPCQRDLKSSIVNNFAVFNHACLYHTLARLIEWIIGVPLKNAISDLTLPLPDQCQRCLFWTGVESRNESSDYDFWRICQFFFCALREQMIYVWWCHNLQISKRPHHALSPNLALYSASSECAKKVISRNVIAVRKNDRIILFT